MKKYVITLFMLCMIFMSCHTDFLDLKRDKKQAVPTRVSDFQAILDNTISMNGRSPYKFALLGSDEYYIPASYWNISNPVVKNGYIWEKEIYEGLPSEDWNNGYRRILTANLVLEGLGKINPSEKELSDWDNVKGTALFHRGYAYFCLTQLFTNQYDPATEGKELGLPLRLEPDPTLKTKRSSLKETYTQILEDLNESVVLLPEQALLEYRPSKTAAKALLARVYLQIGDYEMALSMAEGVKESMNHLLDYNTLDSESRYPFPTMGLGNPEVILIDGTGSAVNSNYLTVDTLFYKEYSDDDLRKSIFWEPNDQGGHNFRGSYAGGSTLFTGLELNEIYLIRAECNVRLGNVEAAITDLNELLSTRYREGTYKVVEFSSDTDELLTLVLNERKKELVLRGLRWPDLKRLNAEGRFKKTLIRKIEDSQYELEPNSTRYIWPIPQEAIDIGNLEQNQR